MNGRIVVGVDRASDPALRWAVEEAVVRDAEVDVVHAWTMDPIVSPIGIPGPALDPVPFEHAAARCIEEALGRLPASTVHQVREINRVTIRGAAAKSLLMVAERADLLVVGARGRGALTGLLGSISHQCVHHAPCPVAAVPGTWSPASHGRVVVGVDGSEGSTLALQWAMAEAVRRSVDLVMVHTWNTPVAVEPWGTVVTDRDEKIFDERAGELMHGMLEREVLRGTTRPRSVELVPVHDASGHGLIAAADAADLLVVGSRGRGGFAALLLGSTSLFCLHHAQQPVVVVPLRQ